MSVDAGCRRMATTMLAILAMAYGIRLAHADDAATAVPLRIHDEVERYDVPGDDLESLRAALRSQALSDRVGGSHGRTHSTIRVEYVPMAVDGGCRARSPSIRLEVTTTLPEWNPDGSVASDLRNRWQSVAAALERHEDRHREHALDAARDLQSALAALGVQPDCHSLRREVDRAFHRVTLRAAFRDSRYDERTRNGLAEGVSL